MTVAIRRRRGTTLQHSTFTGLGGEITVDTTKNTVVVHDGSTVGGFPLASTVSPVFTGPLSVNDGLGEGRVLVGNNDGYFFANSSECGWYSPTVGSFKYILGTGQLTVGGQTVWSQGNDGAGSGLDADLLDGQQGSWYAPSNSPTFLGVTTCSNLRSSAGWGAAQSIVYSQLNSTIDFASTAYHVQDATSAPQWGYNYGDSNRFGLYDTAGTGRLFVLPATGIGSGVLKIVAGDVTVATPGTDYMAPADVSAAFTGGTHFYTGVDPANLTFPVGAFVLVATSAAVNRNEAAAVYLHSTNGQYQFAVNGTGLTGTWRLRGYSGAVSLMQRTA